MSGTQSYKDKRYSSAKGNNDNGIVWPAIPSRLPARLTTEQVAAILGFTAIDVATLISVGLLKPLGKPTQFAVKHFASVEIEARSQDLEWLNDATQAMYDYHKDKNSKKQLNLEMRLTTENEPALSA